jgi:Putative prokaryotic signal transducing protein
MQVDRSELEQRFREMSDAELLRHLGEDLTDLGRDVALVEARRRGLYLEALKVSDRDMPMEVAHGHGPLQVCARYLDPLNAQVLAACLQNAGLAARVMDSDTIFASGAYFGSLPRGGVRVMVPESQLEDALRIRAAFDAGELAIDEDFDVGK